MKHHFIQRFETIIIKINLDFLFFLPLFTLIKKFLPIFILIINFIMVLKLILLIFNLRSLIY